MDLDTTPFLDCRGRKLLLDRPRVMAVLNVTPDSFSDGGRDLDPKHAIERALAMVAEGADLIDVGGESTRPGADSVSEEEELRRVLPVIEALAARVDVPISIDTSKPAVMRAAVAAGAGLINDVQALRQPGALEAAANSGAAVCLMHMQGEPQTMQEAPHYEDVLREVSGFLTDRMMACEFAGIDRRKLVLDPGFGFGKALPHNLALLANLIDIVALERPVLVGLSRKSMLGAVTGREDPAERLAASIAAVMLALDAGALILRVHDVAETVDAVKLWQAVRPLRRVRPSGADAKAKSALEALFDDD